MEWFVGGGLVGEGRGKHGHVVEFVDFIGLVGGLVGGLETLSGP